MGQVFFNESFLFVAHFRRFLNFFLVFFRVLGGFPAIQTEQGWRS